MFQVGHNADTPIDCMWRLRDESFEPMKEDLRNLFSNFGWCEFACVARDGRDTGKVLQ